MRSPGCSWNRERCGTALVLRWAKVVCSLFVCLIPSCAGDAASPESGADRDTPRDIEYENPTNHPCTVGDCEPVGPRASPSSPPMCPTQEPEASEPCAAEGLTCTYGSSITAYCRHYYQCTELVWQVPERASSGCLAQPADFCPSEPAPGSDCTVGEVSAFVPCEYPQAIGCYCVGNPFFRPGAPGQWECYGPPRNGACPELLPNLGDGCSTFGQFCRYGIVGQGCDAPYAEVYCYQGAWEAMGTGCAR